MLTLTLSKLTSQLQSCPSDNKARLIFVIDNIKMVMAGFRVSLPPTFRGQYMAIVQCMAQTLLANLDSEEMSMKLLNFIQQSVGIIGAEMVPLLTQISAKIS